MATLRERWIEALRSGKYRQTQCHLKDRTGYCCLGVLADLVDPASWNNPEHGWSSWHGNNCELPEDILKERLQDALINKNDGGYSFPDIADYIEAHPEIDPKEPK